MTEIINMTPHEVVIIQGGEIVIRLAPSGKVARLAEENEPIGDVNGIPLVRKKYGAIQVISRADFLAKVENPATEDLPVERNNGPMYIVPMLVGIAAKSLPVARTDLIGSDFGIGGVRSSDGSTVGASGFIWY